jgi:subtilisin-like proprotein convertase family protein
VKASAIALFASTSLLLAWSARGDATISQTFSLNSAIPDGDASGFADSHLITVPQNQILDVNITLDISGTGTYGGVNGDLYAYISHGNDIAVLLNRAGRTSGNSMGYDDDGFNSVVFDDSAANGDVHSYRFTLTGNEAVPLSPAPAALTGTWRPDGRITDPANVLGSDGSTALLSQFNGQDPNGAWTLFVADLEKGGEFKINSWGVNITAVPEPPSIALATGISLAGFFVIRKLKRRQKL